MRKGIFIVALLSGSALSLGARDMMTIRFTSEPEQSFPVEAIDEIVFNEADEPVVPDLPSDRVLVKSINEATFIYDENGRCTDINDFDGEFDYHFDYKNNTLSMWDYTVGTFTLTKEGFLKTMKISFMGATSEATYSYDNDGHLIRVVGESSGYGENYSSDNKLTWEDGLLVKMECYEEDEDGPFESTLTISYSDTPNSLNQFTSGMLDNEDLPLQVIGFYGKAPVKFPKLLKWSTDSPVSIKYTFNTDGTVNTETCGNTPYQYEYYAKSKAPADKEKIVKALKRHFHLK